MVNLFGQTDFRERKLSCINLLLLLYFYKQLISGKFESSKAFYYSPDDTPFLTVEENRCVINKDSISLVAEGDRVYVYIDALHMSTITDSNGEIAYGMTAVVASEIVNKLEDIMPINLSFSHYTVENQDEPGLKLIISCSFEVSPIDLLLPYRLCMKADSAIRLMETKGAKVVLETTQEVKSISEEMI